MDINKNELPACYDKGIASDKSGRSYRRWAIKTHFVEPNTDKIELVRQYVTPICRTGDMLFMTAKVMSLCEGFFYTRRQVKPGFLARTLYRFAGHAEYDENGHQRPGQSGIYTGTGVHEPYKMQLVIEIVGLPRFLLACFCSAVTKPFGIHGVFYKVCGHNIAGIDGFHVGSAFPVYRDLALINPPNCEKLCDAIQNALGIPCAVMDSNDFEAILIGKCHEFPLGDEDILKVMKGNPHGQGAEMTPLVLVRPCKEENIS